jgi:hypothetical protein
LLGNRWTIECPAQATSQCGYAQGLTDAILRKRHFALYRITKPIIVPTTLLSGSASIRPTSAA